MPSRKYLRIFLRNCGLYGVVLADLPVLHGAAAALLSDFAAADAGGSGAGEVHSGPVGGGFTAPSPTAYLLILPEGS